MPSPAAILIAGPTASGKSALALRAGREARRRHRQCRFHAGLSRSAHHHRAADAGGRGARAAPALRPCRCGGELFGRALVPRCRRARSPRSRAQGRVPILVGGTGLYFKALTAGACRRCRRSRRRSARGAGATADARARAALHAELLARDPATAHAADAERPHAHRPRARSDAGDRPLARRLAPRRHAGAGRSGARGEGVPHLRARAELYAASTRASTPCWRPARSTEVRALAARGLDPTAAGDEGARRALADGATSPARSRSTRRRPASPRDTRRYAKRQVTWFRHQMPDWPWRRRTRRSSSEAS